MSLFVFRLYYLAKQFCQCSAVEFRKPNRKRTCIKTHRLCSRIKKKYFQLGADREDEDDYTQQAP